MAAAYLPYTGIGSRKISNVGPQVALIEPVAQELARSGWTLRSGGARGCDSAFEYFTREVAHALPPEIFYPRNVPDWCYDMVQKYLDFPAKWRGFDEGVQALIARDMQQILGEDAKSPTRAVLYWTPLDEPHLSPLGGGTRYAVRCALDHGIPCLNLLRPGSTTAAEVLAWIEQYRHHQ